MEDHEDISSLRDNPEAWEREGVWQKLWSSAKTAAERKLDRVCLGDAEVIAQESIITVIERLSRYPEIRTLGELRAFTTSVVYHLALSHREKVIRRSGPEPVDPEQEDDSQISAVDQIQIKERADMIHSTLNKLKPFNRNLLNDFYLNGMKHKEIAAKYNMPIHNVGTYIQRARKEIRECLQDDPKLLAEMRLRIGFNIWLLFLFCS